MSQTDTYTVAVGKIPTRMMVSTSPPSSATVGEEFAFGGYLEDVNLNKLAGKPYQLFIDGVGQTKGTTDAGGSWSYAISMGAPGTHEMYVKFAGDSVYAGCDADVKNPHV